MAELRVLRFANTDKLEQEPFVVRVTSVEEATKVRNLLVDYDNHHVANANMTDHSNMTMLEVFNEETFEWEAWENEDGDDFDEYLRNLDE